MILAGVFERHPDLVFVSTELNNAVEIPKYLARLDALTGLTVGPATPMHRYANDALRALRSSPSEYFARSCYVAGPVFDLRQAYAAGTPNLMWGADVPHSEGTSPFSIEAIRASLCDLPIDELEAVLATRAAKIYHFDLSYLQSVADRIGPTREEVKKPLPENQCPKFPTETRSVIFRQENLAVLRELMQT
jgi:hypothetical protein